MCTYSVVKYFQRKERCRKMANTEVGKNKEAEANERCWSERQYSVNCCCKTCPNSSKCPGSDADDMVMEGSK